MRATLLTPIALAALVAGSLIAPLPARSAEASADGPRGAEPNYVQMFRHAKQDRILREWLELREHRGDRARRPDLPDGFDPPIGRGIAPRASAVSPTRAAQFPPSNVRVNNPSGDIAGAGQAEESIGADGLNAIVTFNDGQGFSTTPQSNLQGYGYSNDGGMSWTDGGAPPTPTGWVWNSDPQVTVDEKTHTFFVTALADSNLADPPNGWNGIIVISATFPSPGAPVWGTPHIAVRGSNSTYAFDKEWMVADSTTHNLYLVYTRFDASGDNIEFQRSTNLGVSWTAPIQLSSVGESGLVQGARVVVGAGPTAPVYTAWYSIGLVDADYYKVRKSTNAGVSFGSAITAVTAYHAFENGAPGFNRGNSVDFPSLAVDRSVGGTHSGRVYIGWHETVNYYGDTLYFSNHTAAGSKTEVEPNGSAAQATPFTLGQTLRGTLTDNDQDWFSFSGTQGQTVYMLVDSLDSSIENVFRLICSDGVTRLALSDPGAGVGYGGQIVFTLPADGTYYVRPAAPPSSGSSGGYRVRTALHHAVAGRARDHRDVFVSSSDDGISWNTPVLVNDDAAHFDDWLPELTVDPNGVVYVEWYDWRDAPASTCGGVSNTYLARSANGGSVFTSFGAVSDAQTAWTSVSTNIAPNQGDYLALFANKDAVYPVWADGRGGTPDVYTVPLGLGFLLTPTELSLVSADATPTEVSLTWYEGADSAPAMVYRAVGDGPWTPVVQILPDGTGYLRYVDTDVTPGGLYHYRLGVQRSGSEVFFGEAQVIVPDSPRFALERAWPNPASTEINVGFALDSGAPATLSVIDVGGRRVLSRTVGSLGPGRHVLTFDTAGKLPAGVYLVRLEQAGHRQSKRVSVMR